jgi:protein SCO1/2
MSSYSRTVQWTVWGLLMLVILAITAAFTLSLMKQGKLTEAPPPIYGKVTGFALTNQYGQAVTLASFREQIWIADIIFTRCPMQCIKMSKRMRDLQSRLPHGKPVKLVSLTADPSWDTPPVLKKYGEAYGALSNRWQFLTGPKREINQLALDGLKLAVAEKKVEERESPEDLFIHSAKFALVDKQGRLRGWFDGDNPESIEQMLPAVKALLREK